MPTLSQKSGRLSYGYATEDAMISSWCLSFILIVLSLFICLAGLVDPSNTHSDAVTARQQLQHAFNHHTTQTDRRQMAAALVVMNRSFGEGNVPMIAEASLNRQQRVRLVNTMKREAQTGDRLALDKLPPFTGWHTYLTVWMPLAFAADAMLLCFLLFLARVSYCRRQEAYLADFRGWSKASRWWFVAYTSVPVGWVFYLASYRRFKQALQAQIEADKNRQPTEAYDPSR